MNIKLPLFSSHRLINLTSYIFAAFLLIGLLLPLNLSAQEMGIPAGPIKNVSPPADSNDLIKRWTAQRAKAFEKRNESFGKQAKINIPVELSEPSGRQKAKITELLKKGRLNVPTDYIALAKMQANGAFVTVDMVTDNYFLDVGGSAGPEEFTTFSFETGDLPVKQDSSDYLILSDHINLLDGRKIDLTRETDRRRLRIQLLQMLAPEAKAVLDEIAAAYSRKFGRPLRVTSLVRSVDYQIELSKTNPNAFKITKESLPAPHATGLAFDLPCGILTGAEQNFLMNKMAEMERAGKIDALVESNEVAANILHVFVYPDGKPPAE